MSCHLILACLSNDLHANSVTVLALWDAVLCGHLALACHRVVDAKTDMVDWRRASLRPHLHNQLVCGYLVPVYCCWE